MSESPDVYDPTGVEDDEIAFDYLKGPNFQMVWADGALGSPMPSGMVHFTLYGERPAIPRRQVFRIDRKTGFLAEQVPEKTVSRGSMVREMHVDVVMQPNTARDFANWLIETLDKMEAIDDQENES